MKFAKTLTATMFAALVCGGLSLASGSAFALGADSVTVVTPANVADVVNATPETSIDYIVVEVCPSTEQVCVDEVRNYTLSAAVAQGGWMGPKFRQTHFYALDPTPANLQALADACKNAKANAPGSALCQVDANTFPVLVTFRMDGTFSQTATGSLSRDQLVFLLKKMQK